MKKDEAQKKLDRLRKDKRAFQHGTPQFEERMRLETLIDQHLYDRTKGDWRQND